MSKRTRVILFGRGHDLPDELHGALSDVDLELIPDESKASSMQQVGAHEPLVVITRAGTGAVTMDALRAVAPQAWILDSVGIVRRRPEVGSGPWPKTRPFELEPL